MVHQTYPSLGRAKDVLEATTDDGLVVVHVYRGEEVDDDTATF